MTQTATDVLANALSLDEGDRIHIAEQLWDSIDNSDEVINRLSDADFEVELLRRCDEAKRDPSVLIPWDVVRTMR